jgi:EAL domain-containing protein (putative c-di-GMP-specific phosphodiesterase class I)
VARALAVVVVLLAAVCASRAAPLQVALGDPSSVHGLSELSGAPLDRLHKLLEVSRRLAAADDTYEFVARPNIPYVADHYAPDRLDADRIDTVLIVNERLEPLFWRRLHHGHNRGFVDAREFLAALPALPVPAGAGTPGIAAAAMLGHGPSLIVALPIYRAGGDGSPRGWLIAASALDTTEWSAVGLPQRTSQLSAAASPPAVASASGARDSATPDVAHPAAAAAAATPVQTPRATLALILLAIIGGAVAAFITWKPNAFQPLRHALESVSTGRHRRAAGAPAAPRSDARQAAQLLQARLAAAGAVVCYQPQIDLRTGQVAGVEALLCVAGPAAYAPATQLIAELNAAGLEWALFEHRLSEACRAQRAWQRQVGHDFAIGVPVSPRLFADPRTLPLVERALAESELEPALLELEIEETAIAGSAAAPVALARIHAAGISIAINGFNATHSLRQLISVPIAKLRIDPRLLLRIGVSATEALLFDGILAASRSLSILVCATGINTAELLSAVLNHGRPLVQGTAVGAPLPGEEFLERLRGSDDDTATLRPLELIEAHSQTESA